jgi:hypothetical protein
MGRRLWQVGLGAVIAVVCLSIGQTQTRTFTKTNCIFSCTVTEPTFWGNALTFIGWYLVVVAAVNLIKFFQGK